MGLARRQQSRNAIQFLMERDRASPEQHQKPLFFGLFGNWRGFPCMSAGESQRKNADLTRFSRFEAERVCVTVARKPRRFRENP
jgi:hypothetical protein